jgi:hypothetical protein
MPNPKFCPACGTPANDGKFCPECGASLVSARTEAAPAPVAATLPPIATPPPPPAALPEAPAPAALTPPALPPLKLERPADVAQEIGDSEADEAVEDTAEIESEAGVDGAEADPSPASEAAVAAAPARKPIKVATRISYDVAAEPYEIGQCTVTLAVTIRPDDGHPDGPQVVIGVRSHDESPLLCVRRLNTLALAPELREMIHQYEATLAERGAAKAAAQVRAAADRKAAEEKRKQAAAARTARTSSKTAAAKKTATSKPAAPAKAEAPQPAPVALATLF